jgi:hypothetical protein
MTVAIISVVIFLLAVAGAVLWVRRSASPEQARQTRILLFGLYFWLLVFAQVVVAAIVYAVLAR